MQKEVGFYRLTSASGNLSLRMALPIERWNLLVSREVAKARRNQDADSSKEQDHCFRARWDLSIRMAV